MAAFLPSLPGTWSFRESGVFLHAHIPILMAAVLTEGASEGSEPHSRALCCPTCEGSGTRPLHACNARSQRALTKIMFAPTAAP